MGLCPSRNTAKNAKFVQGKTFEPQPAPVPPTPQSKLRADAAAFVPQPAEPVEKQPWELFLEQKTQDKQTQKKQAPFARRHDGTYTQEYRKLLDPTAARSRNPTLAEVQAATGAVTHDVVKSWQDCAPKPRPPPGLKKPAQKPKEVDVLREAVRKAKQLPKEQVLEMLSVAPQAQDDAPCASGTQRLVPFGLTDRHYWSGDEDSKQSHQHRSLKPTPQREYVTRKVTGDLEETITEVLYKLRLLRGAEEMKPETSRRYCVGLREVVRACKEQGLLKAVVVAPDLESSKGALDEKLQQLLQTCKKAKIPVVFGLSRLRLGQAIKKNVTVSVLGILDTRGCQDAFGRMLALA